MSHVTKKKDALFGVITASVALMAMVLNAFARRVIATLAVDNKGTFHVAIGNKGKVPLNYNPIDRQYVTYAAIDADGRYVLIEASSEIDNNTWAAMERELREFLFGKLEEGDDVADLICYADVDTQATLAKINEDGTVTRITLPASYSSYRMTPDGMSLVAIEGKKLYCTSDPVSGAWTELANLDAPIASLDRVRIVKGAEDKMFVIANHTDRKGWTRIDLVNKDGTLEACNLVTKQAPLATDSSTIFTDRSGTFAVAFTPTEAGGNAQFYTAAEIDTAGAEFFGLTGDNASTTAVAAG